MTTNYQFDGVDTLGRRFVGCSVPAIEGPKYVPLQSNSKSCRTALAAEGRGLPRRSRKLFCNNKFKCVAVCAERNGFDCRRSRGVPRVLRVCSKRGNSSKSPIFPAESNYDSRYLVAAGSRLSLGLRSPLEGGSVLLPTCPPLPKDTVSAVRGKSALLGGLSVPFGWGVVAALDDHDDWVPEPKSAPVPVTRRPRAEYLATLSGPQPLTSNS